MTAKQFRAERERLKLTQAVLAQRLKVQTNTVTRWETGQRAIPPIVEVALAYVKLIHLMHRGKAAA